MKDKPRVRVLVTFGSKRGGTAEIAAAISETLRSRDLDVVCVRAAGVRDVTAYDAVVIGGALYAGRWTREARRFVTGHGVELRSRSVWMFSSGPLDDSARREPPPVPRVAALMRRVGARGHATFGGRLSPDATGFPASAMAKTHAGDWRDWDRIREWALQVAHAIHVAPERTHPVAIARPRRLLAAACLVIGVTAIAGGVALVVRPDGSLIGARSTLLEHTPFSTFTIPGLLLLLVVGIGNMIAAALVIRDTAIASVAAFAAGTALLVWIVTQMILLRSATWLQLGYLVAAIAIMTAAIRRRGVPDDVPPGRPQDLASRPER